MLTRIEIKHRENIAIPEKTIQPGRLTSHRNGIQKQEVIIDREIIHQDRIQRPEQLRGDLITVVHVDQVTAVPVGQVMVVHVDQAMVVVAGDIDNSWWEK